MKKILLQILFTGFGFVCALTLPAQNLGITTPGTTNYPQTTIGNSSAQNTGLSNSANFLVCDKYSTTVPLTAIKMVTLGNVAGNVKVAIYTDNAGSPGTKLFTEVSSAVAANTPSSIAIPNGVFISPGTYWLVYDMDNGNSIGASSLPASPSTILDRKFVAQAFVNAFPANPAVGASSLSRADCIYFVGVPIEGYAKATKATLAVNTAFSSMNFYTHAAGNVRLAIYSDNGSGTAPSTRQWESGDIVINTAGQPKLTTVNISSGTPSLLTLSAGTYWLSWQWNTVTNGPSYTAGAGNSGNFISQAYGAFPSSWSGGTASAENWTIYAGFCSQPTAAATQTNISCFSANDGTITVTGSGGVSPYTFSVDNGSSYLPPTGTNLRLFTGLLPDSPYKIRVKDNIGCESKSVQ